MSSTVKRLIAASITFVVLLVAVLVVAHHQKVEDAGPKNDTDKLPSVDQAKVSELEVRNPSGETVVLDKNGDHWRVTKPLDAAANDGYVTMALQDLGSLADNDRGIAATRAANHEKLGVDEKHAVEVIARAGKKELAHIFIGDYKSGNTMVRTAGDVKVHAVEGSLKPTFSRDLKDWRDRRVVDETASDVHEVTFQSDNGNFHFVKGGDGKWAAAEGQKPIDKFDPQNVNTIVGTLTRLQASDFAKPGVTPAQAGIGGATATLVLQKHQAKKDDSKKDEQSEAPATQTIVLRLGKAATKDGDTFYVTRDGKKPIYIVSKFNADRIAPKADLFQKGAKNEAPQKITATAKGHMTKEQINQLIRQLQKTPVKLGNPH